VEDGTWSCAAPLPATYPHNRPKNRYISFATDKATNDGRNIAFEVMLTSLELGSCSGNGAPCGVDNHCRACGINGAPCINANTDCPAVEPRTCDPTGQSCVNDLSDSVGRSWWVGPASPLANDVHLLVSGEFRAVNQNWPSAIHVADCEVVPVATYSVRAVDTDTGAASDWLSVGTIDRPGSNYWADCVSPLADYCTGNWAPCPNGDTDCPPGETCIPQWGPPDGATNFDDMTATIFLYQSIPGYTLPDIMSVDIHGDNSGPPGCQAYDPPNYVANFADIAFIILAFQGRPYPFYDPGDCPDIATWPSTGGGFALEGAMMGGDGEAPLMGGVISLVPSTEMIEPNQVVTVDVYLEAVENLGAYQVALEAVGGTAGNLNLEGVTIDTGRQDYVFNGTSAMTGTSVVNARLGAALSNPGGWEFEAPAYVGTFTYRASQDAQGVFNVNVVAFPSSFVNSANGSRIDIVTDATTAIGCDVECMSDGQCDDDNVCTVDTCVAGTCTFSPGPAGVACDDGLFCTVGEQCDGNGTCAGGTSPCQPRENCCEFWDECRTGSCFEQEE
jgi:hypothetical protein